MSLLVITTVYAVWATTKMIDLALFVKVYARNALKQRLTARNALTRWAMKSC